MAKIVEKITLSRSRDIPFNKLVLSQSNVRRVKAGVSIEELAEDIARRTLLQSINVRAVRDGEGAETGMFEIPAGGRRYRALELLVKQKRLAKTALVPCVVREGGIAEEDSLAENVQRAPLHPLDQFRAFQALQQQGQSEEEIAAAFFVSVAIVKQRLRLASVSPKLLELYADDAMTLDQLMAFTVTPDHKRQEQVWKAVQSGWNKEPHQIRRMLTENAVRASDRRARFVGLETYEQAGGAVMRDLFHNDDGGWLKDVALLDRLVGEKLKAAAETIAAEGWKWIEAAADFPYGHTHALRELSGTPADLTAEEQATFEALKSEYAKIEADYEGADELPDEVDARLGEIETALDAFEQRPAIYEAADIVRAGAFVSIDADGRLSIDRGYVRPEDDEADGAAVEDEGEAADGESQAAPPAQRAIITIGGQPEGNDDDDDDAVKPLPDRLLGELTAHRTLALRDAVADHPHVAMTALLHKLCSDAFQQVSQGACLDAGVRHIFFPVQASDLKESASASAIAARHDGWKGDMPAEDGALWDWIAALDEASRGALLAHCISFGVNALHERADGYRTSAQSVGRRIAQADRLARAVGLDMAAAGWRPTADNYLGRVPKRRILEAVREAKGEHAAQLIEHLKKTEMAKEAERLLDGSGWLPEPLRLADTDAATDALPDFLVEDEEEVEAQDEPAPAMGV